MADGGSRPSQVILRTTVTLAFVSTKVGFVDNGIVLVSTVDAGMHWEAVRLGDQVADVSLVGSSAWAVVVGCPLTATMTAHCPAAVDTAEVGPNGAGLWHSHRLPIDAIPGAEPTMARPSASVGLLTGLLWPDDNKNPVLVTDDGGGRWRTAGTPCARGGWLGAGPIAAAEYTDKSGWWLLCNGGGPGMGTDLKAIEWSRDEGRVWSQLAAFTSVVPYRNQGNIPGGDAGPLVATTRLRLWFLTANYLSTSADGGRNWTTFHGIHLNGGGEIATFSFADPSHGWLAVPGVGLWRTVNGRSWRKLNG